MKSSAIIHGFASVGVVNLPLALRVFRALLPINMQSTMEDAEMPHEWLCLKHSTILSKIEAVNWTDFVPNNLIIALFYADWLVRVKFGFLEKSQVENSFSTKKVKLDLAGGKAHHLQPLRRHRNEPVVEFAHYEQVLSWKDYATYQLDTILTTSPDTKVTDERTTNYRKYEL